MLARNWGLACAELAAADPVMRMLIARYPKSRLRQRGDAFQTLARAIVGQQISVKAADSVWTRVVAVVKDITPAAFAAASTPALAGAGLSARKTVYLQDLAQHFLDGRIQPVTWKRLDDEAVIEELIQVRGIGRWTAEMFLIFHLQRPDIWPLDDIGLQKAVALHYFSGERPALQRLRQHGQQFAPWRTVATWYLWRSLDPVEVQY